MLEIVDRTDQFAFSSGRHVFDDWDDILHRIREIRFKVALSDNAFLCVKVDEDQRPVMEHPDFGHDRSPKRHNDRTHVNGTECKLLKCHVLSSLVMFGSIRIELQHLIVNSCAVVISATRSKSRIYCRVSLMILGLSSFSGFLCPAITARGLRVSV